MAEFPGRGNRDTFYTAGSASEKRNGTHGQRAAGVEKITIRKVLNLDRICLYNVLDTYITEILF